MSEHKPSDLWVHYHRIGVFPSPTSRLEELETYSRSTEEMLCYLSDQHQVRLEALLDRENADDLDRYTRKQELESVVDGVFPKIVYSGFLIVMWSVFESCLKNMADHTQKSVKSKFGLDHLQRTDILRQLETFFSTTVEVALFPERETRRRIEELQRFRNALVHHDGAITKIPESLLEGAKKFIDLPKIGLMGTYDGCNHNIAPGPEYVRKQLDLIRNFLEDFADRLYVALYPNGPPPEPTRPPEPAS